MSNDTLPDAVQKERLSRVYVEALAARAGYSTSVPQQDYDSVDLHIQAGGRYRLALDLQLKATAKLGKLLSGKRPFRLSIKNYNDLRARAQTPRLLVVLELPTDSTLWMTVSAEELVLRRRAYWLSLLEGFGDVSGQNSVTVHIPETNIFDLEALRRLMEESRARGVSR